MVKWNHKGHEILQKESKDYSPSFDFSRRIITAIMVIFCLSAFLVEARMLEHSVDTGPSDYHENALRRFEVVTLISLPFTAIHSYLVFRGAKMIQQNDFAPDISNSDYTIVGGMAVTFSAFIGFWDWYHNRGKETSQPKIPKQNLQKEKRTRQMRELSLKSDFINNSKDLFVVQLYQMKF